MDLPGICSILTPPVGRGLKHTARDVLSILRSFNPHPTRRPGATWLAKTGCLAQTFQSSPDPKAGCYFVVFALYVLQLPVSILTRPEGRVLRLRRTIEAGRRGVSILTRPEGRVLLFYTRWQLPASDVSILTRPEGRVLPA